MKYRDELVNPLLLIISISILAIVFMVAYLVMLNKDRYELQQQIEKKEQYELYYEVKLDYFEERYNIDLDDTPADFILYLYENYPELYEYLMEVEE